MRGVVRFGWAIWVLGVWSLAGCASPTPTPRTANSRINSSDPDIDRIPVTTARATERFCNVVAVFDLHTDADSEDKGFNELRRRARALGADAVIGAEFEHGEHGEPSHLSGMAVRYADGPPAWESLGPIEVETPGASSDKGLAELQRRARALGADIIVNVEFEHGEGDKPSRLHGIAARVKAGGT